MLALGRLLHSRGHRVTVVVNEYFEAAVRELGLGFEPLGTVDLFHRLAEHPDLWNPVRALSLIMREGVLPAMRPHYELLASYAAREPIVAISNLFGLGALVAQEKLGIPLATIHLQPSVIWSELKPARFPGAFGPRWLKRRMYAIGEKYFVDPVVCPSLNAWRDELGLPPVRQVTRWWHSPTFVGCLFPDWFAAPQADWPQNLVQTDFPLWDEQNDQAISGEVADFLDQGEPPIAFTPGSANLFARAFFEAAVEACRRLQRRGILLTRFAHQIPASLPPDIRYVPYAPFTQLLPRCAALVHHGGIGSTSQALAAGVPQLLTVMAHDQFDNAERIRTLGVGLSLPFRRATARAMTRRLARLLDSPTVGDACRRVADRLTQRDGAQRMVLAIEQHFRACQSVANVSQSSGRTC